MIAAVVRHAKVDMKWSFLQTSAGYDRECERYDAAPVLPVTVRLPAADKAGGADISLPKKFV